MARRYEIITELYRHEIGQLSSGPKEWTAFLRSACCNYKLPFEEQVLVYAQRPEATAVLELERWNRQFGRWVNKGATGIAVFDREHAGRQRLKYYFDIDDTHESRFARPVPLWQLMPEQEADVMEALENRFGELAEKSTLEAALASVAKNAVEDTITDYLHELLQCRTDSFLEELDELNVEVMYRRMLENSVAYMLMTRCGLNTADYFERDDFSDVFNFNTPETLNALGVASSDIAERGLAAIALTVRNLNQSEKNQIRTFANEPGNDYTIGVQETQITERSVEYGNDLHDEGRLPSARPSAPAGAGGTPWEIRIAAPQVPEAEPQGAVHEPADIGQAERSSDGDRADSASADGADHGADDADRGRDGAHESGRSDEMGWADEQYPQRGGGNRSDGTDLQLNEEAAEEADSNGTENVSELPAFLDEKKIFAIIENRRDDLKYKKQQIELYFQTHSDDRERAEYISTAYQDRYTEIIANGVRLGYKPQENGLLMWEGAYLSRSAESVFSWSLIAGFTAQLIDKKEYYINTDFRSLPPQGSQQLSLFDMPDFGAPEQAGGTEQMTLFPTPKLSQQIIDEALCIGANDRHSRLIVCGYFMKDKPLEDNAHFLQEHYGTNGAGFYFGSRKISLWYDADGMRMAEGETAQKSYATLLSWEQAAKRIRELLDMGRYMPQSELDRTADYERKTLAESLALTARDFSEEAVAAGYAPIIRLALSSHGGFPEIEEQIAALLTDPEMLQKITDEWRAFTTAHDSNRELMRFRSSRLKEILQKLTDLAREPLTFTAAEDYDPQRRFFISTDEINQILRGGEHSTDYRLAVYSFYRNHPEKSEREKFLKNYHGEYSGSHSGNDDLLYTKGKGISFSHGDLMKPYAKVELKWNEVEKRVGALISSGKFLSEDDRTAMPAYEKEQLARSLRNFFDGVPQEQSRPFPYGFDYWDSVKLIVPMLDEPAKVEEIYQMMLPVWETTPQDDRYYTLRKTALDGMTAYRNGTFTLFAEKKPIAVQGATAPEEVNPYRELAGEVLHLYREFDGEPDGGKSTETALLDEFERKLRDETERQIIYDTLQSFGDEADPEEEIATDLALCMERIEELPQSETPEQKQRQAVSEQLERLGYVASEEMLDEGIAEYAAHGGKGNAEDIADFIEDELLSDEGEPDLSDITEELPAEKEPAPVLAAPKPKRERVHFTTLYPEIPAEQRRNFRITDAELGYGTKSEKFSANIAAIRLLRTIEGEERLATPEEQEILSRYVGWGGLSECFDEKHSRYAELKALLTDGEYAAARASSLTAFYTSPVIVKAMYQALSQMGFENGNLLEPACGVGNFFGMLPNNMASCKAYGVELDEISGRIARQLYQNSSIAVTGFEKTDMPDSFFDVAIGNVPFGDIRVADRRYDKHHWLIHDFFFGKTLDKVRPGGIIAFVTSKGTMDKENPAVRKYLAQRADLIGAIRLPNNAFQQNAGTEITSDILFFQKRDRLIDTLPDWVDLDTDENGIRMNSYFVRHPEMILGDMVMESSQYGMESTCKPYENADLSELLEEAVSQLHAQLTAYEVDELDEDEDLSIPADPAVRNYSYTVVDGKLYFRVDSRMNPVTLPLTTENRVRGMIGLRDCVRTLIEYQTENFPDEIIAREREKLNALYDAYVKKYGCLYTRGNNLAFSDDSSYCLLCSLEVLDDEGNFKCKADMFSKRTIRPHEPVTHVDTAAEALAVSISEKARIDLDYMAELSGKSVEELTVALEGVIFREINCPLTPEDFSPAQKELEHYPYVTADEYLSGNVRQKLRMAKALQEELPAEKKAFVESHIRALEAVQPVDLTAGEIGVRIGASWIPTEIYKQFMFELIGTGGYARQRVSIVYSGYSGEWNVTNKSADAGNIRAVTTYGTKRISAYHILEQTLNQKVVRIFDTVIEDGKEKPVLNVKETAIAQDRQELIKSKFAEWLWRDIDRREMLCGIYNETFNSIRPREYDGSHIRFSGMNPEITLRKHQIDAIAHIMYGGNTLLAHEVGAGKTYEMVAAAMEMKRLGLCSKSLIVVPNHITEQWAAEWLQLYPAANVLVATERDFERQNRRRLCARIATGDYDAIIIGHSQLTKIPLSRERQQEILTRQIDEVLRAIADAKSQKCENFTIKQMERTRKALEVRLEKLNDQSRKDDIVTFEELGVDRLFVDESHNFKNLFLMTKMRNVGGVAQTEAQKSSDLFAKCQYLDEITDSRGTIFATGTPISNSMVELYTIQRYLQYRVLQDMGLLHFDDWASDFGETVTAIELSPEGSGYRPKTRFAKFFNLPELMSVFKMTADIQTADMLHLPVPKANYHNEVIKPSELQKQAVLGLAERAEAVRKGGVDPSVDNMLKITNDGRKLALDMRLINPLLPDDDNGKIATCARNVFRIWEQSSGNRSAQLVFCDLSTPKADGSFNVYDDLREKLLHMGIPEEEIAYIHSANTEAKKKELFAKVRSGQIRVLLGSTAKMGAGTNVQDRLIALHDLDCPWRPSDLAQRLGRIVRQGNQNPEVEIYRYVTEGTFDAYLYQLVEAKQRFIAQIMTSKTPVRAAEDVDETALSYAEIKALATGNPLIIEKSNLDMEVRKLGMLRASHLSQKYALEELVLRKFPAQLQEYTERMAGLEQDISLLAQHPKLPEAFPPMEIFGTVYTEKEAAGKAIIEACTRMTGSDALAFGKYRGFSLTLSFDGTSHEFRMTMKGALSYTAILGADVYGNITRIDNVLEGLNDRLNNVREQLADTQKQLENARTEMEAPFAREEELNEKTARLNELNVLLNLNEKDHSVMDAEPDENEGVKKKPVERER